MEELYYCYNGSAYQNWSCPAWNSTWLNNWTHFAIVRNGTNLLGYINGVLQSSNTFTSSTSSITTGITTDNLTFGNCGSGSGMGTTGFSGYLDEIRVSVGVARYTSNFNITGGDTITTSGGYTIHTFTGTGTLTVSGGSATCDILVVGGGGGAGLGTSGGGGAGGYTYLTSQTLTSGSWTVTVGAGGAGVGSGSAQKGGTSSFSGIYGAIADGGGYSGGAGGSGGSGGGASPLNNGGLASGIGTGNAGGNAQNTGGGYAGSGGGGAGAAGGSTPNNTTGGAGGAGLQNSITGTAVYYAGGGGGGTNSGTAGAGTAATGGGGAGTVGNGNGINGTNGLGGGGGGTGFNGTSGIGGSGGSGVVILRYLTASTTITTSFVPITFGTFGGATTSATDASYANTVLLLHADGNNGVSASSSAYYDSSPLNALMSVSGTPTFSSTQKKFGVSSLSFNNSYLQTPTNANYVLGSKDFTIEFWIYFTSIPSGNFSIFGNSSSAGTGWTGNNLFGMAIFSNYIGFQWKGPNDGTLNNPFWGTAIGTTIAINNWTHIAIVRNGSTLTMYINGTGTSATFPTTPFNSLTTDYLTFGRWVNSADYGTGLQIYLDEIRVTIGTARYTSNFSVPTSAFPNLPTGPVATDFYSDPNGNLNTKVDGSGTTYTSWALTNQVAFAPVLTWYDQSTRANHARAFPGSWPVYDPNNNLVDFTGSVVGSYGGNSSGNNFMSLPDGTVPYGSGQSFTLAAKHGVVIGGAAPAIITGGTPGTNLNIVGININGVTSSSVYFLNTWGTNPTTTSTYSPGNTITYTYGSSTLTPYVNGVVNGTTTFTLNATQFYNSIGYIPSPGNYNYFNGQINFISVFNSVLSTVDRAIVESQGNYFDPYYYNTVLLLKGDSQISSTTTTTTITDSSLYNATMVNSGTTIASLGTFPNGNTTFANPMLFNGSVSPSGNYLQTPSSSLYTLGSKDFTIECWIYFTSTLGAVNTQILTNSTTTGGFTQANIWNLYYYNGASTYLTFQLGNAGPQSIYSGVALSNSTWYHIAVTRSSNNFNMYVNGTRYFSTSPASTLITYSGSVDSGLAQQISIGGATYTSAYSFPGYLDDVRITNGVARYTTNFNVPLGPSSAIESTLPVATGGTVSGPVKINGINYMVHQFLQTGSSSFTLNQARVCDILVVAGGGGGGNSVPNVCGGGGGAGGFQYFTGQSLSAGSYTVTVGDGGAIQTIGNNSQFGSLIASIGGGAGSSGSGGNGGSGGGGGTNSGGGTGTVGQGNSGGVSSNNGGGGGGAGGAGTTTSGGIGLQNNITGTSIYYAGGGGGGYYGGSTTLPGGLGGGGLGGAANATNNNTAGISNTGGGGGGNGNAQAGTRGGSGIVIVRYPVDQQSTFILDNLSVVSATGLYACNRLSTIYTGPVLQLTDASTVLLMHFDGNFTDSSVYNSTITNTGTVTIETTSPVPKLGTGSAKFNGSNYLSTPSTTLGQLSDDFTIEFWMNYTSIGYSGINCGIIGTVTSSLGWVIYVFNTTNVCFRGDGPSTDFGAGPGSSSVWNHYAFVRYGSVLKYYLNGISQGTPFTSSAVPSQGGPIYINGVPGYINFVGNIDELRIIKGFAIYTSNFTPPIAPFTIAQQDLYADSQGNLTTGPNGTGNNYTQWSTTSNVSIWYDQSYTLSTSNVITFNKNNAIGTNGTWPRYDPINKCVDFTGNKYLTLPSLVVPIGDSPYTISLKHGNAPTSLAYLFSSGTAGTNTSLELFSDSSNYSTKWGSGVTYSAGSVNPNNTITSSYTTGGAANSMTQFVNGTVFTNASAPGIRAGTNSSAYLGYSSIASTYLNSQLYYASIFTSSLSSTNRLIVEAQSNVGDPYFNSVVLLLSGDNLTDSSLYNAPLTATGSISAGNTSNKKYGTGSIYSSSLQANNYITSPSSLLYNCGPGKSFTIETWIYIVQLPSGTNQNRIVLGAGVNWCYNSTQMFNNNAFFTPILGLTSLVGGWHHLAYVYSALTTTTGTVNIYIDGVNNSSSGQTFTRTVGTADQIYVGGYIESSSAYAYFDDVRVTFGVPRYTTNFTPPLSALANFAYFTVSASYTFGQLGTLSASAISSMKGAYSLRLLLSTYTGPVVQLSNGTTNMNGYADASGVLWTSSTLSGQTLQSWLGASTGYIKTLYDQSGNGSHVAQATQGNCPTINFTVSPPTMTFASASSQYLKVTPGVLNGQSNYTYFAIWNAATAGGFNVCDENVNGGGTNVNNVRASLLVGSTTYGFCGESNDSQSIAPYSINTRINTIMRVNNTANPNIKIRSNGTDYSGATSNPGALSVSNGAFGIGLKLSLTNEFFNGTISHVVVFNINLSDADTTILASL